ncbi:MULTISPECIES: ABC transporter ATP-binding protein [unclassified Rothia (in: high G+C Gram-positive bacteria)]|uniref:ABC transporter ATP-binding protein n=1 Tax=unclassified Rothia (in: high G+C Gram-positive bacteria) TaxID=2689056 RepID=UPI001EF46E4E|nr:MULTISPECIES: ATP-binding cassette domain-containing protein [unclassified Rothia (in: high G+C Gram-positive bacteria)]
MIAGFESVNEGTIRIGGQDVADLRACDHDVAMVLQSYALCPNTTAHQNMAFALESAEMDKGEINHRVEKTSLELEALLDVNPANMFGGQHQRVSMGRAIVHEPKVFLMDDPLSNLDARLHVSTCAQVSQLQRELDVTTVYMTHDQTEVMTIGGYSKMVFFNSAMSLCTSTTTSATPLLLNLLSHLL